MRPRDPAKEKAIRRKALEIAVKEGLEGLSVHKVARAAKVSPATLYVYFEDLDDLLVQVYLEESEKAFEAMMVDFDPGLSFAQGLRVQWFNRARYYLKHPLSMLFLEQFKMSPLHERAAKLGSSTFRESMHAFLHGAIRRGELIPVPIEVYWAVAIAPLYQLVKFHLNGKSLPAAGPFVLHDAILEQALGLVLKALTPAPATRARRVDDSRAPGAGKPPKQSHRKNPR